MIGEISPQIGSMSLINPTSTTTRDDLFSGAFNPTNPNNAIIVGARGKMLRWNGTALTLLQTGADAWFNKAAWKPDGSYALIATSEGSLEKWNGTYLTRLVPPYWATSPQGPSAEFYDVAWKPDGSYALIVGENLNGAAMVWKYDGTTLTSLYSTASSWGFGAVSWKPDGSYALIAGGSGALYRYDGVNFNLITTGTSEDLWRVAWKPDGSYALILVAEWGTAGKVFKYDGASFTEIASGLNHYFEGAAWKPGGSWALIPCYDSGLIYNFTGTGFTLAFNGTATPTVGDVAFTSAFWRPDGQLAFAVGYGGTVLKYDGSSFTPLNPASFVTREALYGSAWKPDGSYALIVGGTDLPTTLNGVVLKYDGSTLTQLSSGLKYLPRGVAWKPDGSYALIAGSEGTLVKFDGTTFTPLTSGTTNWLRNIAWKPDGSYALIAGFGGTLLKFDGIHQPPTVINTGTTSDLWDVAWKPDGSYALICGDGGVVLKYNGVSLTTLSSGVGNTLRSVAWKPTGEYALIVGRGQRMLKFDGSDFTYLYFRGSSYFSDVAWKPDGSYAIAAGGSSALRLYDGSDVYGQPSFSSGALNTVAWKPDGSYALLGNEYGLLLRYSENPATFYGAQQTVRSSGDGNLYFILTGYSASGKVPPVNAPWPPGYDVLSSGLLYGLANRVQYLDYDTGSWIDHSTGKPLVSKIPAGRWIVIIGGRAVHNCANYYETVSGESPARVDVVSQGGKVYYEFLDRAGKVLYSMDSSKISLVGHEDAGILMTFKDADGRYVIFLYGFGYQGSWAAALYFKERIWMTDAWSFDDSTYVVHWVDANMDGIPQLNEIYLVPLEG
jgi:WD40 repeat protein